MDRIRATDKRHPDWLPLLVILVLSVGYFYPVLFMDQSPAMNSLRKVEPWRSAAVDAGEGTVEILPSGVPEYQWSEPEGFADDLNRQFIPWGMYAQERIRSGEWPLWNPHVACGQPLYANHQVGLTNPVIFLTYLLVPGVDAFSVIFFLIFLLAGWGMYAYMRSVGLGRWPSFLTAITYQFMLGYIPALDTLIIEKAIFPFLLYSIEMLFRSPRGKGAWWAILSTVLIALVQTSCHVQEAVFIHYILGPYIVFIAGGKDAYPRGRVWVTIWKRVLTALMLFIPALLIGLIQNLPTYEFYSLSARSTGFGEQIESATRLEENLTWIQALMIAFPRLFGDYIRDNLPLEHYLLNYGYVGMITIMTAPLAGWIKDSRRHVWFWRIIGLITFIAIVSPWFYFNVLCTLPLFRVSLQQPFSPLFFSLVVLAGFGFQFLLKPKPKDSPQYRYFGLHSLLIYAAAISLGGILLYAVLFPGKPFNEEQVYVFGQMGIGVGLGAAGYLFVWYTWLRGPWKEKNTGTASGTGWLTLMVIGLLAIILIDLWPVKAHFNPFVPVEKLYYSTPETDFLERNLDWEEGNPDGPYRFGRSWKEILPPNTGMMYGLDDFGGYDSNLVGNYFTLIKAMDDTAAQGVHFIESPRHRDAFESKVWDMLGVKYVVAHTGHLNQFAPEERWRHTYMGNILIVENMDALPRMVLVDNVTVTDDHDEMLEMATELYPSLEAVVLEQPDDRSCTNIISDLQPDGTSPGTVTITAYEPETVSASVNCDRPSLLSFFDAYYPGWEVFVDGDQQCLERVNYAFKGVFIPAGEHTVEFMYNPRIVFMGMWGTIAGLILMLLLAYPVSLVGGISLKVVNDKNDKVDDTVA